jgi:deazaflavin-dependent oxidoreductase (nitroreductase family)
MTSLRDRRNKPMSAMHSWVYRRTRGRLGARFGKSPVLLLTTTGRTSGQPRTKPLIYVTDGPDRWVVAASNAGQDHHPGWFHNLQASPEAEVEVGGSVVPVTARVAEGEERAALWPRLVGVFSWFDDYAKKTDRPIPVVVLTRR